MRRYSLKWYNEFGHLARGDKLSLTNLSVDQNRSLNTMNVPNYFKMTSAYFVGIPQDQVSLKVKIILFLMR